MNTLLEGLQGWLRRWGMLLVYAAVFFFIARSLITNWDQVRGFAWVLKPGLLVLAFGLYAVQLVGLALLWAWSVRQLDVQLPYGAGVRLWLNAFLSRYIPGGVWSYAFVASSGKQMDLPVTLVTGSYILQLLAQLWVGALTALPLLPILFPDVGFPPEIVGGVGLLLVTLLAPVVLKPLLEWPIKLMRLDIGGTLSVLIAPSVLLRLLPGFALAQGVLLGILFIALRGLLVLDTWTAVYVAFAYAVATMIGLVVVFLPQGIGVREASFAGLVALVMPASVAFTLSIGLRLLLIVYDLLILLGLFGWRLTVQSPQAQATAMDE